MKTVVMADDDPGLRALVRETITSDMYTLLEAADGDSAWRLLQQHHPDLALLDVMMPGRNGVQLTRAIKTDPHLASMPVILLTALADPEQVAAGQAAGADWYLTKPFSPLGLLRVIEQALAQAPAPPLTPPLPAPPPPALTGDPQLAAYAHDLRQAYEGERARREELQATYLATVKMLAAAIEARDPYTGGHVERVAAYAIAIGRELGWEPNRLAALELGAVLHDIGKIGVEDRILRKPGPLNPDEWEQLRQHPVIGARMLAMVPFLQGAAASARHHHERYDGQGYPDQLAGQAIPAEARVVSVADTFDAMTSARSYRAALPAETALAEIERRAGAQFDPTVVAAFLHAFAAGALPAPASAPF
jgi:putative two-component system response regulator